MILFYAHSGIRYLVLLAGVVLVGYALAMLVARRPHGKPLRIMAAVYAGSLDLNILAGAALLFTGRFYPAVGVHLVFMLLATVVAHLVPGVMKRRPPEERSVAPYIVGTAVSLALVVTGITMLGRPIVGSG